MVYDINNITDDIELKLRDYNVRWICSEDLYEKLKKDYPFPAMTTDIFIV